MIRKVTEQSSLFNGKIIPLFPLVLILAVSPVDKVSRWVKEKRKVSVNPRKVISKYSNSMDSVDLFDKLLESYRPILR